MLKKAIFLEIGEMYEKNTQWPLVPRSSSILTLYPVYLTVHALADHELIKSYIIAS